jgi:hypothetical protein
MALYVYPGLISCGDGPQLAIEVTTRQCIKPPLHKLQGIFFHNSEYRITQITCLAGAVTEGLLLELDSGIPNFLKILDKGTELVNSLLTFLIN